MKGAKKLKANAFVQKNARIAGSSTPNYATVCDVSLAGILMMYVLLAEDVLYAGASAR